MTLIRTIAAMALVAAAGIGLGTVTPGTAMAQAATAAKPAKSPAADKLVERGRYLAKIAGCNDCHTPGYMQQNGKVPEAQWLVGDSFGWRGPWGTTYPINLRLYMQALSEDEWLKRAATLEARPPMPWWVFRDMTREDLRAIYRFVRHLGPAGQPAPAWVPPDKEPKPPYATFPSPPPK